MNELLSLFARQLASDFRRAPARARRRHTDAGRVARAGTIAELRSLARREVPRAVFDFVDGAAGDEVTARSNESDLAALRLVPRVLTGAADADLSTIALGRPIAVPLIGAPTGLAGLMHPRGELAVARALHRAGTIFALSTMASFTIEELTGETPGPTWFQLYLWRDRGVVRDLVERARAAGCAALVVTVDVPRIGARERDRRNGFGIPPRLTARLLADALVRPRWTRRTLHDPRVTVAGVAGSLGTASDPVSLAEYVNTQFDPTLTWADLEWLRAEWSGPLAVKGILHPDDARQAVATGADAVIVSNHGGRQLDHAVSAISALGRVADAVGSSAEVYMDGGVRRGVDVVKAVATGARACLVGRPLLYGVGAGGDAGAERAVAILVEELRLAMTLLGCPAVAALDRSLLG